MLLKGREPSGRGTVQAVHGRRAHCHAQGLHEEGALGGLPTGEGFPAVPGDVRGAPGLKRDHQSKSLDWSSLRLVRSVDGCSCCWLRVCGGREGRGERWQLTGGRAGVPHADPAAAACPSTPRQEGQGEVSCGALTVQQHRGGVPAVPWPQGSGVWYRGPAWQPAAVREESLGREEQQLCTPLPTPVGPSRPSAEMGAACPPAQLLAGLLCLLLCTGAARPAVWRVPGLHPQPRERRELLGAQLRGGGFSPARAVRAAPSCAAKRVRDHRITE